MRFNDRLRAAFTIALTPDPTVAAAVFAGPSQDKTVLFEVKEGGTGALSLDYNGWTFTVGNIDPQYLRDNSTLPILNTLSTLVNYASQSNASQTAAPLRLLPLQ